MWGLLVQRSYFMKSPECSNKFHTSACFPTIWSEITLISYATKLSDPDFLQSFANGRGVICGSLVARRSQVRSGSRQWESMYGGLLSPGICCPDGNQVIPRLEFQAMPWKCRGSTTQVPLSLQWEWWERASGSYHSLSPLVRTRAMGYEGRIKSLQRVHWLSVCRRLSRSSSCIWRGPMG